MYHLQWRFVENGREQISATTYTKEKAQEWADKLNKKNKDKHHWIVSADLIKDGMNHPDIKMTFKTKEEQSDTKQKESDSRENKKE
jgi:hypothetical protein